MVANVRIYDHYLSLIVKKTLAHFFYYINYCAFYHLGHIFLAKFAV